MERCDVLIVGAGPAGLASAACLAQRNISFIVIEAEPLVGARWRRHYDRLCLHTTKTRSTLPRAARNIHFVGYRNSLSGLLRQIGVEAEVVARAIANRAAWRLGPPDGPLRSRAPGNSPAPAASSRRRCS